MVKKRSNRLEKALKKERAVINPSNPSEIILWLDNYQDIFSDFDPRPYSQKALSEDFLAETRRASMDKDIDDVQLVFVLAHHKRNFLHEATIKKRLREHFNKHFHILKKNVKNPIMRKGINFFFTGVLLMVVAAYLLFTSNQDNFLRDLILLLFEPGGWFFFWEGLDLMIFESKKVNPELDFYKKMSRARIRFVSL